MGETLTVDPPMIITMQMLLDAQEAYHALLTGSAVAEFVDQNGEKIRYTAAKRTDLWAYIEWLKGQLGLAVAPSGPMRVWM